VRELDVVLDALPAMVGYWDSQLRNVVANAAYVDFFGRTPDELKGRHIRELLGEELYAKNERYIRAALAGEPQLFDREIIDPTGTPRYTQASYIPDIVDGEVRGFSVLVTDITARRVAERAAVSAQARFQALFDLAPTGKFLIDADGVIVDANHAAGELLQQPTGSLVGRSINEFIPEEDRDSSADLLARLLAGERIIGVERQYLREDGTRIWAQMDAASVRVPGDPVVILAQIQDVGARREERTTLARLAMHDPLTGLLNRRGFLAHLAETPRGALVVVDLDEFKAVNDELGHQAGDDVLIAVAELLKSRVRDEDAVGRLGGDEYVLVLSHARADEAASVAEDLTHRIAEARLGLPDRPVRASAGVAAIEPGLSPAELIAQADRAMYAQKARARGQEPDPA
jgi:diguanylate cyclase (GGDEF)-like protein/PAS domain S-box-containing protein